MIVHIQMFARCRDVFGAESITASLPDSANVALLRSELARMRPEIAGLISRSQVAVNNEFVADEVPLSAADEIALIPPVSGG